MNHARGSDVIPPLVTRFGVHTDRVLVGHFGAPGAIELHRARRWRELGVAARGARCPICGDETRERCRRAGRRRGVLVSPNRQGGRQRENEARSRLRAPRGRERRASDCRRGLRERARSLLAATLRSGEGSARPSPRARPAFARPFASMRGVHRTTACRRAGTELFGCPCRSRSRLSSGEESSGRHALRFSLRSFV